MSERRKAIVRMDIARAAVALFTRHGVAGTTGDDIAHVLGISSRTLWRYFPTKESCVSPLLTSGLDLVAERLRSCPREVGLLEHLESKGIFHEDERMVGGPVADLIRMTPHEPALMAVWLEVHHAAESVFAEIFADRLGSSADDLTVRVQAATFNVALRLGAEEQAHRRPADGSVRAGTMGTLLRTALKAAAQGPAFGPVPGAVPGSRDESAS